MCVRIGAASSKGSVSSVPEWFRPDSVPNLIKQREIVTGRPCGSVAQCSECSLCVREILGSCSGRAMCFCLPVTLGGSVLVHARAASIKKLYQPLLM